MLTGAKMTSSNGMDVITRMNSGVARIAPRIGVVLQRIYMKFSAAIKSQRRVKTIFGLYMDGNISDYVFKRIYFFGLWEPELTKLMIGKIKTGQTVVDVGANQGYFSLLMSRLVGPGKVIAIEASPNVFKNLKNNIDINKADNVKLINYAVSDHAGTIELFNPDPRNSGMQTTIGARQEISTIVPCDRFISIIASDLEKISFIKIDIEGAERSLLIEILDNVKKFSKPLTVVVEISERNRDLIEMFTKSGFSNYMISNDYSFESYLQTEILDEDYGRFETTSNITGDYVFELSA